MDFLVAMSRRRATLADPASIANEKARREGRAFVSGFF
jgi:hypothetical protein